ncbi:MAG: ribosomal-processing cysteine protease Prp [Clostridia bacterium]|nr:ribosomal-processing cysteine protease Prp [Clostridia bacterium]
MTEVIYTTDANTTAFTVSGHSNAPRINGADLCCCSVSTLVFTLMKALSKENLPGYHHSFSKGLCSVTFNSCADVPCKAHSIIDTIMNGFELLRQTYPDYIKITINETPIKERRNNHDQ